MVRTFSHLEELPDMILRLATLVLFFTALSCGTPINRFDRPNFNAKPDLSKIEYSDDSGETSEDAIKILNAKNSNEGISAEYAYVTEKYGVMGESWSLIDRGTSERNEKRYDRLTFEIIDTRVNRTLFFDITDFYGKW